MIVPREVSISSGVGLISSPFVRELARAQELALEHQGLIVAKWHEHLDCRRYARFEDGFLIISVRSGVQMRFPLSDNPRLAAGTAAQLNHIEISPFGLHWPDLDEDLSFLGLARGDHGQGGIGVTKEA